ncbi:MAG: ATP-dependent RecD-like DNA helicase [Simkaniaceae bacterium]|nr:ATP-dependent RecD-like DNA helicase [Simkaniaceae bacterium]
MTLSCSSYVILSEEIFCSWFAMLTLAGCVERIVFRSEETGFTVARLTLSGRKDPVTVVGVLPHANPGEEVRCTGEWKHHATHGRQFEVCTCEIEAPRDVRGIRRYLASGAVKGIGPTYAGRIVDLFGEETLRVIDTAPERLLEVAGIGKKLVDRMISSWSEEKSIRRVMIFLQSYNISPAFAKKVFRKYGEDSVEIVRKNPYVLAREISGIGFKTADLVAQNTGIARDASIRIEAAIEFVLWELSGAGHVCYPEASLLRQVAETVEMEEERVGEALSTLVRDERVIGGKAEGVPSVWVAPLFHAENNIVKEVRRIREGSSAIRSLDVDKAIAWAQKKSRIRFGEEQIEAIGRSLVEKVHIITGGPGTGKSTITRAILAISSCLTGDVLSVAPTGRAAKRLSEITRRRAFTIHSVLEPNFQAGGFRRNRDHPLKCALLIVDEASMIDTLLMNHLLKALPSFTRVIFIGDIDQLPSVGPGTILQDFIDSGSLPVTRLKRIFRQGRNSRIVESAHRINAGYFPDLTVDPESDFQFLDIESPEEIVEKTIDLIRNVIPKKLDLDPLHEVQVLSPMKRGVIGIDNYNHVLQGVLNPNPVALSRMGVAFREGDKVMQTRNNYDKKVYNGDIGIIVAADTERGALTVRFDDRMTEYDTSDLDEIVLAYAVSIHKYQGSECPCIIMPVHVSHFKLLFKNLLYTGLTRGKKQVFLLGTKKALAIAVNTDDTKKRFTGLREMLARGIP